ncbi:hypothetical protein FM038_000900 [Shewanella eurypsychrophilus]|uniref:Uncharacterized protein n=1 Tax=Shewanella eurypsychrophilus TaxID=2593656 RepID=A0ABX6V190_9GAMM|nr:MULTISPECIES: hypothetical protein [Shewanella]QFU20573.1 hypothetical protein FS418_00890 [Shewanella sp. YLB-09]QFU20854.1 hypothetical protein FS418_02500 [Shewanella sp. YLB-09]QPG56142.2 hypothetical protein FM038_000900 [Shewanella eurypsychrophilus]
MTEFEWMIQPYDREEFVIHTDKNVNDIANFFDIVSEKMSDKVNPLTQVFNDISPYVVQILSVANKSGIRCYLKQPGRNNHDQTMPFLGVYFARFGLKERRDDGQPNVTAGGKLLGIDISQQTINFQLFQPDKEGSAPKILKVYKDNFKVVRGALRIPLIEENIEVIITCLQLATQLLKGEYMAECCGQHGL